MAQGTDVEMLAAACEKLLTDDLRTPPGYPDSLALCIVDAVWSLGVRYGSVVNVLDRYRGWVLDVAGGEADRRGARELVDDIDAAGGPERFAEDVVDNRARTSTRSGILKAAAVHRAAAAMVAADVDSTAQLRSRYEDPAVEATWRAVKGQRSGISWHYLRILAGVQDVKADRMICAFVSEAIRRTVEPSQAARIWWSPSTSACASSTPRSICARLITPSGPTSVLLRRARRIGRARKRECQVVPGG